jgi:C4-dicarboxylate-specific signal transduction histidine kinase
MPSNSAFRPRARLVAILGEHLISDQAVGLIELVKNCYDADATEVTVELLSLDAPEQTTVVITDNGCGMSLEDVTGNWLSPAVDHKEKSKRAQVRTALGRLPIGEKGVGRFAAHQMGRRLELVTRAKGQPEVVLPLDWDEFDDGSRFLDEVKFHVREREPEVFTGRKTGTQLTMRTTRAPWDKRLLSKVHRALRRLQSPLQGEEKFRFTVRLKCPEYPEYENIDVTDVLDRAHYEFRVLVSADGVCDFEYYCKHPALPRRSKSGTIDLTQYAEEELQGEEPQSGPFWMNFYVWDRTKDHLQAAGVSRQELDAQCGVSLFRDGLRVLPYGEPGDDWLFLDQERIQAPAERIGNNQIIGLIHVDQSNNLQLRDKTNREGLIENAAFLDLRALARAAIRLFTTYWKSDRPRPEHSERKKGTVQQARQIANSVKETTSDDIEVTIPSVDTAGDYTGGNGESPQEVVVSQRRAVEVLIEQLDGVEHDMRTRDEKLEILLHLAATGLAAERVAHEFGRQVVAACESLNSLRTLTRGREREAEAVKAVENCLQTLRNEFRVLAPYEAVQRSQRAKPVSVREAAELALQLNRNLLEEDGIESAVSGDDFEVRCRPASLVQVLDNLVHNACYWTATVAKPAVRRIEVFLDADEQRILVADSGPGIHDEAREHMFDPFFTMKAGGKGLGLYISAELAANFGGGLRTASDEEQLSLPDWAKGAVMVLEFTPAARDG